MSIMKVTQKYHKTVYVEANNALDAYAKAQDKFEFEGYIKDETHVDDNENTVKIIAKKDINKDKLMIITEKS